MAFRKIEGFIEYCERTAIAGPVSRRGCSEEEIRALETQCGVTLPHSYRTFLATMGHWASHLFCGDHMDVTYSHVLEINSNFPEYVVAEGGSYPYAVPQLPDDAIIIASRLFNLNWFIRCNDRDESPVWCFNLEYEAQEEFPLSDESFVEWLYSWACHAKHLMDSGWFKGDINRHTS